ncbi:galactosylgalactosylxylosylprotein 3-beta-glucuronosyltransferase 2-like [Tachypleus tridentatus]|uniref:galactosylgalactosylxylosylprotein 3-beta-glucuronosyltransferase 2-like n=1 Tax=Tachypleus tridentatus TaxID=6853 RepID=UPI003FD04F42
MTKDTYLTPLKLALLTSTTLVIIYFFMEREPRLPENAPKRGFVTQRNICSLHVVTPTNPRPPRLADLTRLSQTLRQVSSLHWVLVDDTETPSVQVQQLLRHSKIEHTYLTYQKNVTDWDCPEGFRDPKGQLRRLAIQWIVEHAHNGSVMFVLEDSVVDLRLFDEVKSTKNISVWPVGFTSPIGISTPIVSNGHANGFHPPSSLSSNNIPADMMGYAVSVQLLRQNPQAIFYCSDESPEEQFLQRLGAGFDNIELKAQNCTEIYVWRTRTKKLRWPQKVNMKKEHNPQFTNLPTLYLNVLENNRP